MAKAGNSKYKIHYCFEKDNMKEVLAIVLMIRMVQLSSGWVNFRSTSTIFLDEFLTRFGASACTSLT